MNNNIGAAFNGTAGLTKDYYEALVTASMAPYRDAIKRAQAREDVLDVRKAVYTDLGTKLDALNDAVEALRQTGDDSVFDDKKVDSSDEAYATATATSEASDATYAVHVDNLAVEHRAWSDQKASDFTLDLGGAGNTADFTIRSGSDAANDIVISVSHGDSLTDIQDKINQAVQDGLDAETLSEDHTFTATVVDNRLVLEADSTGSAFALTASDTTGTVLEDLNIVAGAGDTDADGNGFVDGNETAAEDAQFTVNGISVTRSSNTGIDDVLTGVTFDLKKAHGTGNQDTVDLTVGPDTDAVSAAIKKFVDKLNDFTKWMKSKSGVSESGDGTYKRGVLADDFSLKGLRRNLVQTAFATWSDAPSNATYTRLDQVGLDLGDGLVASLDSGDLETALSADYDGVVSLFEGIMANVERQLDPYVDGSETRVDQLKEAAADALESQEDRIERMEAVAARREELVRDQIAYQFAAISNYNQTGRYMMTTMYSTFA